MKFLKFIFQDWITNQGNVKGRFVLCLFRFVNLLSFVKFPGNFLCYPFVIIYRIFVEWILCIELPWKLRVGRGLRIYHGQSLVVNDRVIIGDGCILRNSTTIGVASTSLNFSGGAPVIGDNVDIGANVVIIGGISIGSNSIVGAGSVVIRDVEEFSVVAGNPARLIRRLNVKVE